VLNAGREALCLRARCLSPRPPFHLRPGRTAAPSSPLRGCSSFLPGPIIGVAFATSRDRPQHAPLPIPSANYLLDRSLPAVAVRPLRETHRHFSCSPCADVSSSGEYSAGLSRAGRCPLRPLPYRHHQPLSPDAARGGQRLRDDQAHPRRHHSGC